MTESRLQTTTGELCKEVVFIDTSVANWQMLIAGVNPGMEVVLLETSRDALGQMAEWAQNHEGYDAIHLISHGSVGSLKLGSLTLDSTNLSQYADTLKVIGSSLNENGDFLLYGCNVAQGQTGVDFIGRLAQLTGADVAASDDLTGADELGGNWVLEKQDESITTAPISMHSYGKLLAAPADENFESYSNSSNATTSLTLGSLVFRSDGTAQVDIMGDVDTFLGEHANVLSGKAVINDHKWDSSDSINYFEFSAVDLNDKFKLNSFSANAADSGSARIFTITGYSGGSSGTIVASVTGFDFGTSGTYGSGSSAIDYTRGVSVYREGTLVFGSAWDNIDTVRLTRTDATGFGATLILDNIDFSEPTPAGPSTTVSTAALSADTGSSSTDWITQTAAQIISGTLSANLATGEKVEVSYDNGASWSDATTYSVGQNTWSTTTTLAGSSTFQARVADSNGSGTAYTHSYTLDTTAPTTTIATASFSADTGASTSDFITKTAAQTVSGTLSANLAAGETVQVSLDNGATWTAATATVGQSTWSLSGQTLTGSNTLKIKVTDTAGNDGTLYSQT